jgi:hypothetical protein
MTAKISRQTAALVNARRRSLVGRCNVLLTRTTLVRYRRARQGKFFGVGRLHADMTGLRRRKVSANVTYRESLA